MRIYLISISLSLSWAFSSILLKFILYVLGFLGLLTSEASSASQASTILKELIKHMDQRILLINESIPFEDALESTESSVIKSICAVFGNALSTCDGIPNEHILDVISALFLKLGKWTSWIYLCRVFQMCNWMYFVSLLLREHHLVI